MGCVDHQTCRRCQDLQDQVDHLTRLLNEPDESVPKILNLSRMKAIILRALLRRERVARETLLGMLYPIDDEPEWGASVVGVQICGLRRVLSQHDIHIVTVNRFGWYMTPENKAKVKRLRESEIAMAMAA